MQTQTIEYRRCPECGFLLTKQQWDLARFDYPCPMCEEFTITQFLPHFITENVSTTVESTEDSK